MEKGVLLSDSRINANGGITSNGDPNEGMGFVFVDFAKKIRNIDGNILRKDGYTRQAVRGAPVGTGTTHSVSFAEDQNIEVVVEASIESHVNNMNAPKNTFAAVVNPGGNPSTFAAVVNPESTPTKVNFRPLVNKENVENHDTVLPHAAMEKVLNKFENTLVGYFIGKNIAFRNVESYATNSWGKFGFLKLTRNGEGVFLFKFANREGVDRVLQSGPWFIRGSPIILNTWTPEIHLCKAEVKRVPVWIKLHNFPVVAYSEDGLSLIATQVGKPIMLDAYTSSMCVNSWGRIAYARALVEINAKSELKKEVSMAISLMDRTGHRTEVIKVEYEWKPPHCLECKCFGHSFVQCLKRGPDTNATTMASTPKVNEEGFTEVRHKKYIGKQANKQGYSKQIAGLRLSKPNVNYYWAARKSGNSTKSKRVVEPRQMINHANQDTPSTSNCFDVLNSFENEDHEP